VDNIHFGPSSVTWQKLVQALAKSREDYQLPDGSFATMSAMTISASELGTFLDPSNREFIDVMVDLWDGKEGTFEKWSKTSGNDSIENPWINLIGCTTPSWIGETFTPYFAGGGFASRTIFIWAEHKRQLVAYPKLSLGSNWKDFGQQLVDDLQQIATMQGEFVLSPAALKWGTAWYEKHFSSDNPLRRDERFSGYFARKQTHIHKLAMVRSASRTDTLEISLDDLEGADQEVTALEQHMLATFGHVSRDRIAESMSIVLLEVRRAKALLRSDLYRAFITRMSYQTFEECLRGLAAAGLIAAKQDTTGVYVELTAKAIDIEAALRAANPPLKIIKGDKV